MITLDLVQGTPAWIAARLHYFTASEAPAMLGLSKYMTRSELLKQKATGIAQDVSESTQRLFDSGHAAEAATRPIAEGIVGEDLFPVTGALEVEGLPLLASFDGLTMCEDVCWENKLWNDGFAQQVRDSDVPDTHWPQLEQQLLISGAGKVLFTVSDGTEEKTVSTWYASQPARRAALIAGWKQFAEDLANYQHVEVIPAAVAAVQMQLPAVSVQVSGSIALISNLDKFGAALTEYIGQINQKPQTDQDFADLEATVKTLKAAEDALIAAESNALAQTADIDEMRRAVALYRDTARSNRLTVEKLVKAEKENRRAAIVLQGKTALAEHMDGLNKRLGKPYLPAVAADFAGAIKGLKTMASIQNAVDTELARCKSESSTLADKVEINLLTLREQAKDHPFLFADAGQLVLKANDDLIAIIKSRIAEHAAAEAKRLDAERERIRAEEQAKAQKEAADKAEAERKEAEAKARAEAQELAAKAESERIAQQASDQAESATVPAVTLASPMVLTGLKVSIPMANVRPIPSEVPALLDHDESNLLAEINRNLSGMSADDLRMVLHYIGRIQAQRVAA